MIAADEGISAYHSASSLVMIRGVTCNPGRSLGRDPVARTTSVAVIPRSAPRPARRTPDPVDLPGLPQARQPGDELVDDLGLERLDLRPIGFAGGLDAP